MTGREFFSRFPELHSFFLGHLQVACQGIDRSEHSVNVTLHGKTGKKVMTRARMQ